MDDRHNEAVDWYNQRVEACTDAELKGVLAHNRDEEIEHAFDRFWQLWQGKTPLTLTEDGQFRLEDQTKGAAAAQTMLTANQNLTAIRA